MVTNSQDWKCAQATESDEFYASNNFSGDSKWSAPKVLGTANRTAIWSKTLNQEVKKMGENFSAQWIWYDQ